MNVKFYDFETKQVTEMPQEELAPGCVKANIEGMEGSYYVILTEKQLMRPGYRHPRFDEEGMRIMGYFVHVFSEVKPMTAEQWEDGFRKDTNKDKEILLWLRMAEVYQHFTTGKNLPLAAKKDYLNILLIVVNNGLDFPRSLIDLSSISTNEMKKVIQHLRESDSGGADPTYFMDYMESH